jgi:hypothetical protein
LSARSNAVLLTLLAGLAHAAAPVLRDLEPRGARRGTAVTLNILGSDLADGAAIHSSLPGSFAPLTPKRGTLPFLVEVKPDAPVGLYPIRIQTREGLSNVLLFSVGAFPETQEEEPQIYSNDSPERAVAVELPVTINGKLRGADRDYYRFQAKAGQRLVLEVEARRAGSAVDPLIRVYDSGGREIAVNDDAPGIGVDSRLDVTFPADGTYFVLIQDSKFSAQAQNFYRLKIGSFAYAGGLFPLGWKKGEPVEVELFGGNLAAPVKVSANGVPAIHAPGEPGALPFPFALGDRPEALEPVERLAPDTVVNGRIAQPAEVDRYKLAVQPGEHWMIELEKASLGTSRLYGVLTVSDASGRKLGSAGDATPDPGLSFLVSAGEGNADPYLAFQVPPEVTEVVVAVEDLLQRGGPDYGYRLLVRRQPPDFNLTLVTPFVNIPEGGTASVVVSADRRGLIAPIQLSIPDAPEDLLVEGGHIPGEGSGQTRVRSSRQGVLTITPKPGAKSRRMELAVWGEVRLPNGEVIRRRAVGPGLVTAVRGPNQRAFTAPWLGLELPAMVAPERPAALEVTSLRYVRLIQGMETDVEWKLARRGMGITLPRRVNAGNVPGVGNLRVLGEGSRGGRESGKLTLVTTVGTPPMKFDMILDAAVTIEGREETLVAPAITFDIVPGYTIEAPTQVAAAGGVSFEIAGQVRREEAFPAPITIKADNLPLQVTCTAAEVSAKTVEFRLACQAGPGTQAGEYEIELASSSTLAGRDKENVPYTIPAVPVKLKVEK